MARTTIRDEDVTSDEIEIGKIATTGTASASTFLRGDSSWAAGGLFTSYAIIADQKSQNTAGGTFTLGAWRTRDLQTELADPDGIVSISSNQFTLAAGSYLIRWSCPSFAVYYQQSHLYNITDSSVEGISMSTYDPGFQNSQGSIRLVITGSKTFEIQHRSSNTYATEGFGRPSNLGTEQYTLVEIFKES